MTAQSLEDEYEAQASRPTAAALAAEKRRWKAERKRNYPESKAELRDLVRLSEARTATREALNETRAERREAKRARHVGLVSYEPVPNGPGDDDLFASDLEDDGDV